MISPGPKFEVSSEPINEKLLNVGDRLNIDEIFDNAVLANL